MNTIAHRPFASGAPKGRRFARGAGGESLQELKPYLAMREMVLSIRIPADQLRTVVHVNALATGIYHYRVHNASGELGQGKLNVAHTH